MTPQDLDDDQDIAPDAGQQRSVRLHRPTHVAEGLDVSLSTVRRLVREGILEAVYVGASMRISDRSYRYVAKHGTRRSKQGRKK